MDVVDMQIKWLGGGWGGWVVRFKKEIVSRPLGLKECTSGVLLKVGDDKKECGGN